MLVRVQPSRTLSGSRQIGKAGDYQSGHYAPLTQLADVASSNLAFSQFESCLGRQYARLAQLELEHTTFNRRVRSSNLRACTKLNT